MQTASRRPLLRSRSRSPSRNTVGVRPPIGTRLSWSARGPARSSTPRAGRMPRTSVRVSGSGLGCDVTNGDPVRIDPEVRLIPATISGKADPFAWVTFNGHWGERETWVYDGPTGPALKRQWTAPASWMENLRADSIRVNAAGVIGPAPSDIFCDAVENGSALFTLFTPYPLLVIGFVAAGLGIAIWAVRQSWRALRDTWGVYWPNLRVFA